MRLLLDTHLLLRAAGQPGRLSAEARMLLDDAANEPAFSVASLWEIAIKRALGRDDFQVELRPLRGACWKTAVASFRSPANMRSRSMLCPAFTRILSTESWWRNRSSRERRC